MTRPPGDVSPLQSVSRFVACALYHAKVRDEAVTLQSLEREKAEFMRILVHELRARISASKSMAAVLRYVNREMGLPEVEVSQISDEFSCAPSAR